MTPTINDTPVVDEPIKEFIGIDFAPIIAVCRDLNREYVELAFASQKNGNSRYRGFFDMIAAFCLCVVKAENVQTRTLELLAFFSAWKFDADMMASRYRVNHLNYVLSRVTPLLIVRGSSGGVVVGVVDGPTASELEVPPHA